MPRWRKFSGYYVLKLLLVILDASVLINFLCVDRVGLLSRYPAMLLITEHVVAEVTEHYPEQKERLAQAIQNGTVRVIVITDIQELTLIATLRGSTASLGIGECSAIAVAITRGFAVAVDDKAARRITARVAPHIPILQTQDIIASLIRDGALNVPEADGIKEMWEREHRFKLKIRSFGDIV